VRLPSMAAPTGRPLNFRILQRTLARAVERRVEERAFREAREHFFTLTVPALFPDKVAAIIGPTPLDDRDDDDRRCERFVAHFEGEYFPICDLDPEWIGQGLRHITEAWEDWRWEQASQSPGEIILLLAVLGHDWFAVRDPQEWCELRESCPALPAGTLVPLPTAALTEEQATMAFAGTPYEALRGLLRWIAGETGSPFLDIGEESGMETTFDPDDLTLVRALAEDWRTVALPLVSAVEELAALVAADPARHLAALLDALAAAGIPTGLAVGP